jgi:hypothetical protein
MYKTVSLLVSETPTSQVNKTDNPIATRYTGHDGKVYPGLDPQQGPEVLVLCAADCHS